jgi:hypothetical protein
MEENNEAKGQQEIRKYLHHSLLGSGDVLRAVVCNCVGPAECEGTLKQAVHTSAPRRNRNWWRATQGRSGEGAAPPPRGVFCVEIGSR